MDEPLVKLESIYDRADYVQRVCAAWDFGVHPEPQTFAQLKEWREVFNRFPVLTSPAYHAFRAWFGWEPMAFPDGIVPATPRWKILDRLEGRGEDFCEGMI